MKHFMQLHSGLQFFLFNNIVSDVKKYCVNLTTKCVKVIDLIEIIMSISFESINCIHLSEIENICLFASIFWTIQIELGYLHIFRVKL